MNHLPTCLSLSLGLRLRPSHRAAAAALALGLLGGTGAWAAGAPLAHPSVQELQSALASPAGGGAAMTRSFTRTQPPSQDGLCAGTGASAAAGGAGTRSAGGRNLEVVAYVAEAPHVDLAIQFGNDSDAIGSGSRAALNNLAKALKSADLADKRFVIVGHTSDTGPRERNLELSCARAIAVRKFLLKAGVAAERLAAYGFGPDKPLADTPASADANRRVEIRVGQ